MIFGVSVIAGTVVASGVPIIAGAVVTTGVSKVAVNFIVTGSATAFSPYKEVYPSRYNTANLSYNFE